MHRRLLTLARTTPIPLVITIGAGFIAGLFIIAQAWMMSQVVNGVFLLNLDLSGVSGWMKAMLVFIGGRAILAWISDVSAGAVAVKIKTDLREQLIDHLMKLGPAYTRGERTGEVSATIVDGVEALDAYYSQYLPQLVISALVPLSILLFIFPIEPLSGLVLLLTAPLIPFFMVLIGKTAESLTNRQYETLSRLSAHFLDSLQGLTTLKQFNAGKAHAKTIARASDQFRDSTLRVLRVTFLSAFALELIATISTAIVAVEVGLRLLYGQMEFQPALFVLILAPEFYMPLRMLGLRFHAGMAGTSAARRIYEILDTPLPSESAPIETSNAPIFSSITFESVSYSYKDMDVPALQDINLTITAGQRVALVGASGAGKSTLASLLLRFVSPVSGKILCDSSNLLDIPADLWREQIAWVPQHPHLFHDTVSANIRIADPDADETSVRAAARAANLDEFIESLPDKYETVIGEEGARLSGGQAQRLALARAFMKDAPILILDESTSSLDPEQEYLIENSIDRLMSGRTVITIAHRLNTVVEADLIVVLDNGRIVEMGNHASLIAEGGHYARMVSAVQTESGITAGSTSDKPEVPDTLQLKEGFLFNQAPPSIDDHRSPLFRLVDFLKGSWLKVGVSVILGSLTIFASVGLMGTSAYLLSAAALHPSIATLQVAIVGVRFFGISRGFFRYMERLTSHTVTFNLLARLRLWFYEALEPLAPARLMEYRGGDLLSRIVADVDTLENFYVRVTAPPLVAAVVTTGTVVLLGSFHPSLGWLILIFLLILGLFIPIIAQLLSRKPGAKLVAQRADLHTKLVDGVQGISDLIVFGRQSERKQDIERVDTQYGKTQRSMSLITGFNSAMGILIANLALWSVLFVAIPLISGQILPGVVLASLALIALASFEAVNPLPQAAQMLGVSNSAAGRLFEIVDASPEVTDPLSPVPALTAGAIQFRNVSFRYHDIEEESLKDINFSLEQGSHLAVVGPSGAGKTTILNLLLRYWDSPENVLLDGQPIKAYKADDVRRLIAVVSQNAYFFNTTIKQNLLLANPHAPDELLQSACRLAQIHDFIVSLPREYDTWIGEQGMRLSGGERQRLAIARALLKETPFLFLDEPTANLDPLTEKAVLETIWQIMQNRTTLLITHRLIGLDHFDEILVMDRGRVVERGTHINLLNRHGLYRRLWDLQNRFFLADK